ncbi:MAG: HlyD family efflux transporter periplasmic adaptor subunit [Phenylobacterium sp.]|uniref:efflux RND transporter periplasmic adaptor subunit n=1 Tax=Phenylobacterium sp. TaxID=1871053 RepID=UPI00121D8081|nr:HlyD family efflux transporter periplasmic adaptor subunit [Phenylobacterium sp.]TAJ70882.1 MAG: HlyD family efflux transporter periplasmic adaptor subunit [Phenylobacterium sp.]
MDRKVARPRRRLWLAAGIGAVVLGAGGAAAWLLPDAGTVAVRRGEVEIAEVRQEPFHDYIPVRAVVAPLTTVFVTAVEGGQVEQVIAQDGSAVAAGAPLARLANPQLRLAVTSREAEIAGRLGDVSGQELELQRAQADRDRELAAASYDLLKARRDLEKRQRLYDAGFESPAAIRSLADEAAYHASRVAALSSGNIREAAIGASQRSQMRQLAGRLSANLGVVTASLDALTVKAPLKGRLTNFDLQPGQTLKAGETVGQVDVEGAYKLTADFDEFYVSRVAPGQAAQADLGGRAVLLRVGRVLPQVSQGRFRVEFGFAGAPPAGLRRGQTLEVRLTLGATQPAVVLPNGAWLEGSGGAYAFVVRPDGRKADRRAIVVRRRNPQQVEVASGLRRGEKVVVSSYAGLEPYKHLILR